MTQYTEEFRRKVVQHYLSTHDGVKRTAKIFGVHKGTISFGYQHIESMVKTSQFQIRNGVSTLQQSRKLLSMTYWTINYQ
ncbi:transposase, partial [Serratia marcescens]|nr:transposase [Serratia marcescens]